MNTQIKYLYILLFSFLTTAGSAQYIQVDDTYTAQQLVNALVSGSCAQVSNVTMSGWAGGSGGPSAGYFTAGTSGFPFANGIVLSTGFASSAPGPNSNLLSQGNSTWQGDADLEAAIGVGRTFNATVLEFDFVPYTTTISFDYIFASEQYLTSISSQIQCSFTDGFAFLLKEEGGPAGYQNLAVVPGTNIPVKVNTVRGQGVCPAANEQYFGSFNPSNSPINFNGQTVILKAEADVQPGVTYHIKLVVADQGNHQYDSAIFLGGGSFNATTDLGPDRLIADGNALCALSTQQFDVTNPAAIGYEWFRNGISQSLSPAYTVTTAGTYTVKVQYSPTCFSEGEVEIEYLPAIATGNYTLLGCDADNNGFTTYNLNQAGELAVNGDPNLTPSYFLYSADAASNTAPITNTAAFDNTVVNQVIYVRLETPGGCFGVAQVTLGTSSNTVTNPPALEECDTDGNEDGIFIFDLTQRSAQILNGLPAGLQLDYYISYDDALTVTNPIPDPVHFTNTTANAQTVYARIYNAADCYGIAELDLNVFTFGGSLDNETVILCQGIASIPITAPSGYTYQWNTTPVQNTQTIIVRQPGSYTVTLTNANGCTGIKTYIVAPSGPATGAVIDIIDFAGRNNTISILPQGLGVYEYSLDGINYQDSPVFTGMASGEYTVYINDKNGCGPPYTDTVYVLDYPKFFTPNHDGINELWRIPFMNFTDGLSVTIFDRYGKLITGFTGRNSAGWDGTFKGRALPASDYWFVLHMPNGRIIKGHFALVR